jgi:hypothetical protein
VLIRILGDFAINHARTGYQKPDGTHGAGRYTDYWQLRNGRWQCVSAHVTRLDHGRLGVRVTLGWPA